MEEWKEYKLGEVVNMIPGFAFKSRDFGIGKDIAIKIKDIRPPYVEANEADNVETSNYNLNKLSKFIVHKGEFLLAMTGATIGKIGRYICEEPAYVNQRVLKFEDAGLISYDYLYYYLSTNVFQTFISNHIDSQSAQPNISSSTIGKYLIKAPSIKEQKRIASILSSLDDKIELNRRINANLEAQAQALFKSWFVDFEPFRDGEFVESELGMIPKGWRVGTLSEITDITMGTSPSGTSYNTEGKGDVFYQGRAEFGFRFPQRNMFTTEAKRFADINSVLVSVRAPVGDINVAEERCCIGRGLASVQSKKDYNSFILYLLKSLRPVFERFNGEGTVFGSINKKAFEELKIIVPPESTISKYESIVSIIDLQIKDKVNESRRLATLRDTLLPRLMSGELKVNEKA